MRRLFYTGLAMAAVGSMLALAPTAQTARQFQSYRNPKQAARLFQTQLHHDKSFRSVTVTVYNPTLLIAKGYIKNSGRWFRFRAKVYKVSTYRLLMVTSFTGLPGTYPGYVDTTYAI